MRGQAIRHCNQIIVYALLLAPLTAVPDYAAQAATRDVMAQAATPAAIADYRRKLKTFQEARAAFEEDAGVYWNAIADKRRGRNAKRRDHQPVTLDDYVLTQPPLYD